MALYKCLIVITTMSDASQENCKGDQWRSKVLGTLVRSLDGGPLVLFNHHDVKQVGESSRFKLNRGYKLFVGFTFSFNVKH